MIKKLLSQENLQSTIQQVVSNFSTGIPFRFGISERISNPISAKTCSTLVSSSSLNESRIVDINGPGSPKNAKERCNKISSVNYKPISKFSFCNSEKGSRSLAGDRYGKTKSSYSLCSFQNGRVGTFDLF